MAKIIMKATAFAAKAKEIATKYDTLYVMGCFGAPMTAANKARYVKNNAYNKQATRTAMIQAASASTFGFDCVCLVKGLLWGWNGDKTKTYGGAAYGSNGVPDCTIDSMLKACTEVSADFSKIPVGAFLYYSSGHCGIYIGDGLAVESTPSWKNKVQITAVSNIGTKAGYNSRRWAKWGKLPYLEYSEEKTNDIPAGMKEIPVLLNGKEVKCVGMCKDGTNYIRLRDVDEVLGLAKITYNSAKGKPAVDTK